MMLRGVCKVCKKPYEMPSGIWVVAHLSDPTAWPLQATLPCGHVRKDVEPYDFTDE